MNDYIYQFIIVVVSSGALGTIITAISKKRERQSMDNIEKVVASQTQSFKSTLDKVQSNQMKTTECLEEITKKLNSISTEQKELKKSFKKFKNESEELDLLIVQKLREKKIFNGESEEILKKLLEYKKKAEEEEEEK